MKFTVRYAHLEKTDLKTGDIINPGDLIGIMGSTGDSTAAHLHIDCVEGSYSKRYTLQNIENNNPFPAPRQLNFFIDKDLFRIKPVITTFYCDPEYQAIRKKVHFGYDLVPEDRHITRNHFAIYWNRTIPGKVSAVYRDDTGYGICVYIVFDR